jgi:hypothetical protein
MSKTSTLIRISLWVVLIFGLGIAVGRLTSPHGKMDAAEGAAFDESAPREAIPEEEATRRETIRSTRRVMQNYATALSLSEEQIAATNPLFIRCGQEMAKLPKQSLLRRGVLQKFHEQLAPHLNSEQKKLSDEILKKTSAGS